MNRTSPIDCSQLSDIESFDQYMQLLRNVTGFDETLLHQCQQQICSAIWGIGNPDVSGIGMLVGYVLDVAIGIALAALVMFTRPWKLSKPYERVLKVFFDSAVYFALSIQLASIVVLAKRDYGIDGKGIGSIEQQITWAISIICILPLIYPLMLLKKDREKKNLQLFLYGMVLVLALYPFISQCIHNYAPSQIGEGAGEGGTTIIMEDDWQSLTTTCFGTAVPLSDVESRVFAAFEFVAVGGVVLFTVSAMMPQILQKSTEPDSESASPPQGQAWGNRGLIHKLLCIFTLLGPVLLSVPLFWGVFRLRSVEQALAEATDNVYIDDDWTFGQIVAVVLFAPVFVELGDVWYEQIVNAIIGEPDPSGENAHSK